MAEYIEREKLGIGRCNPDVFVDKGYAKGWNAAIDIIQSAPAADVRPVVRGKWVKIRTHDGGVWKSIACSNCKYEPWFSSAEPLYNFCPNCGADMREES